MCGIAGIIDLRGRLVEQERLQVMVDSLDHRGPDASALLLDRDIGVGHTRLSILDVSAHANQPMRSPENQFSIVYNGELYNFRELRRELEAEGRTFSTTSDTEVVLQAYQHWGEGCLGRFNGMFAFAIVDHKRRRLFAARDRFGIKPFHYSVSGGQLVFASEVKAIVKGAEGPFAPNGLKLLEVLVYRELIRDTLLKDVSTLAPGHVLQLDLGNGKGPVASPWFHLEELPDMELSQRLQRMGRTQRVNALDEVLQQSVERHLISDVPLGTLCSGGLDSSLLTAMACRLRPDTTVYHVDIAGLSERPWAERVARHLGIELRCVELDSTSFLADYVDCIYNNDYPLAHASNVPTYHVCDLARQMDCKVLLTGEGADEQFGGYHWRYRWRYNYLRMGPLFRLLGKVLARVECMVTGVWTGRFDEAFSFKSRAWVPDVVHLLADQNYRRNLEARCEEAYRFVPNRPDRMVRAAVLSDLWDYIGGILHEQDRSSMKASIESRVPFLDLHVARFAANLPIADKFSRRESKIILKELGTRYLPREVVYREKMGFGIPVEDHLRLLPTSIFEGGVLQREFGLHAEEVIGAVERDMSNFGLMFFGLEFWGRMFLWGESPADLKERWIPGLH